MRLLQLLRPQWELRFMLTPADPVRMKRFWTRESGVRYVVERGWDHRLYRMVKLPVPLRRRTP